jgi:HlyD family secretion protein
VVSVNNEDLQLRPYLTANLAFIIADKKDVLLVPNAALRWQPARQQIAPDVRDAYLALKAKKRSPVGGEGERGFVWVKGDDGAVRFIEVQTGLSDNVNTEVLSVLGGGALPEHTQVIVSEGRAETATSSGANPFLASPFGNKKKD